MSAQARRHLAAVDTVLARLIEQAPVWKHESDQREPYEYLTRAVAHQQLTGKAAATILGRFAKLVRGAEFPPAQRVAKMDLARIRSVGLSTAKAEAIRGVAQATVAGTLPSAAELDTWPDADIIACLTQLRGIGPWTVQMMLMFRMRRPDVMPVLDYGVRMGFQLAYRKKVMPTPKALAAYAEKWAPYRSYGAWLMWRAVDLHKAGKLSHS